MTVALRKESVDRNPVVPAELTTLVKSLSARRAWIEIANFCRNRFCSTVALRKESVDRNRAYILTISICTASLSARRAWIEMDWASVITAMTSSLSARRAWIEMRLDVEY